MADNALLAHDVGTSGVKSLLVVDGNVVASESSSYSTYFPQPGWIEQDPEDWWKCVRANSFRLAEKMPEVMRRLAGVGVSGHMVSVVPLDAQGRLLSRAPIHSDQRAFCESRDIDARIGAGKIYDITGNVLDPRMSLCKILWFKKHRPDVYAATKKFLTCKDYVNYRLTGQMDSSDCSEATHALLADVRKRAYAVDILRELSVDLDKLPTLRRGVEIVGTVSERAAEETGIPAGTPVAVGCGDGSAATVGAGATKVGDTYCSLGTTSWIATVIDTPPSDATRRVFTLTAADGINSAVFGTTQAAGSSLSWIMKLLGEKDYAQLEKEAGAVPVGSGGLLFLNYLEGERTPIWDANARGLFFGLDPAHGRGHLLRSVLEGVAFSLRDIVHAISDQIKVKEMRLIGGGARVALWRRIISSAVRLPLILPPVAAEDATALGTAATAGVAVGVYRDLSEAMRVGGDREEPNLDDAAMYDKWAEIRAMLYPGLKEAFRRRQELLTETTDLNA